MKRIMIFLFLLVSGNNIYAQGKPWVDIDRPIVNGTTVELIGFVTPNSLNTTCWFLLTKDTSDKCPTPKIEIDKDRFFLEFILTVRYLDPYSIYYASICAENDGGEICDEFIMLVTGAPASDNEENKSLVIYPNPVLDQLGVYTIRQQEGWFMIRDMSGRVVQQSAKASCLSTLDVRHLLSGIYLMTFIGDGVKITKKFLKQ